MKKTKKVLALVLSAILVFSVMPFCTFTITAISSDQVKNVIDQIKANEYKPGTTPPTGQYRSGTSGCFGFADLLCRKIFGHNLASQKSAMELNSTSNFLKVGSTLSRAAGNLNETTLFNLFSSALPGDIIQMDYTKYDGSDSRHTTVFYSANNNGVVFYHAGSSKVYFGANSGTQPLWGTNGSILTWANLLYCLRSSDDGISLYRSTTVVGGSNPQGCIDAISAGAGSVYVSGWAFDRDNLPESLQVNVYIGGELHQICANVSRTDVDAYYNVGEFHGFNTSISTSKTGWQEVAIYAINIGGGDHTYLGCSTVYITPADITPPTISNVVVSDVTSSGYTVTCTVTDNSGISSVSFPTWTEYNDQDDLFWREGTISGNTVTFRVNTSEHNNESGKYITHIYAYDIPGNCTSIAINANVPDSYVSSYYYNGHTYEVYDINMTWAEAKEYCENKSGGHLLTIEDAEEQAFINQILSERTIYAYAIGGTDAETEGVWKWVNGKTVSYTNWIEGQPDNCGNEDNMWIYADNASNYFGKWNDYPGTDWSIGFICEIEKYSIEYNLDGGSNSKDNPDSYTYDTPAISLKNPTKNGYVFKGWYSDSNFTKKVTKIDKDSSGNKTLYAKWEKKYIVNYKLSGGKNNSNNPKEYTVSSDITLKKPTREGYTFKGWYSDSKFKKKVTKIEKGSKGNKTLYAKWAKIYKITYKLKGGTNNKSNPKNYEKTSSDISLKTPTRKGYVFKGWYSDSKLTKRVKAIKKGSTGDKIFYAKWAKKTYAISYKLNGGKNNAKNSKKYTVTSSDIIFKNPTRKGYTFKGWYSNSKFNRKVTKIVKGSTGNVTLYAKWEKKK